MLRFILLSFLFILKAQAHPVIYQDGFAFSSANMASVSDNYLMYTFSNGQAAGLNHYRFTRDKQVTELGLVKYNKLLWRRNTDDSQANIYFHAGLGVADNEFGVKDTREAYMTGVDVDWETRTLYTSLKHYQFHSPSMMDLSLTQGRVGFSPALADFKDLQTWVMLQGMYLPDVDRTLMITPLLRFFYHNVLWEMGSSLKGEWMFNFMVHY